MKANKFNKLEITYLWYFYNNAILLVGADRIDKNLCHVGRLLSLYSNPGPSDTKLTTTCGTLITFRATKMLLIA